jgi:hypothetical protein
LRIQVISQWRRRLALVAEKLQLLLVQVPRRMQKRS